LNFNDQRYFIRVFKKITSMTPRQYREKYTII
ncbi:AraC family transcriptional regulator, partial [Bacillus thuringiensis]|nr:AraC family transcriptional regulator [Bacillus thuringiensis]